MVLLDGSRCCNPCLRMYLTVPSLYLSDFYDIFFFLFVSLFMSPYSVLGVPGQQQAAHNEDSVCYVYSL